MKNRWGYSLWMLATYVTVFVGWKYFPSRAAFLGVGGVAVAGLVWGMRSAYRTGYFANRVDLALHVWVIIDLVLETLSFEAFRLYTLAFESLSLFDSNVAAFHDNNNFFGCTAAFIALLGGYRWFALRRHTVSADGAAYGQAGV